MKRVLCIILTIIMLSSLLVSCGEKQEEEGTHLLSFSQAQSIEEIQKYDGEQVSIIGYMSTLSPISGEFMYLMNLPYQSCPFCVPNTSQLSNTMAVYAKNNDEFKFTDRAIQVTGILEFGDYTDEFGYQYNYRIVDATYAPVDTSNMSEKLKLWQQLASTDVITDVYNMFEYVNFTCYWPTYTMNFPSGNDYLYPSDARLFIETDGAQFNYGFKDGYFEDIIATVESVDKTAFADLVKIINDAKALSEKGYTELINSNCTPVAEYSGVFNDGRSQYKLNKSAELESEMTTVYMAFSEWLSSWEI